MKFINNNEEFVFFYAAKEYTIPAGEFEIADEAVANHLKFTVNKWGKDVKEVKKVSEPVVKKIDKEEEIITEEPQEGEVITEETVIEEPKKRGRKKKDE